MRSRVAAGAFVGALVGVAFGLPAATIVAWMHAPPLVGLLTAWAALLLGWAVLGGVVAYFILPSGPAG